jgi:hypothetical protein
MIYGIYYLRRGMIFDVAIGDLEWATGGFSLGCSHFLLHSSPLASSHALTSFGLHVRP